MKPGAAGQLTGQVRERTKTHSLISDITPDFLQTAKGSLAQRNDVKKVRLGAGKGLRLATQKNAHQSHWGDRLPSISF